MNEDEFELQQLIREQAANAGALNEIDPIEKSLNQANAETGARDVVVLFVVSFFTVLLSVLSPLTAKAVAISNK